MTFETAKSQTIERHLHVIFVPVPVTKRQEANPGNRVGFHNVVDTIASGVVKWSFRVATVLTGAYMTGWILKACGDEILFRHQMMPQPQMMNAADRLFQSCAFLSSSNAQNLIELGQRFQDVSRVESIVDSLAFTAVNLSQYPKHLLNILSKKEQLSF